MSRKRLLELLRFLITPALLIWVATRVDLNELGRAVAGVSGAALLGALGFTLLTPLLAALRWRRVLGAASQRVALLPLFGDVLVGSAYNLVLPTSFGGDVMRAVRCAGRVERPGYGYASVLLERLVGFSTLSVAAVLGAFAVTLPAGRALPWVALSALVAVSLAWRRLGPALARLAPLVRSWPTLSNTLGEMAAVLQGPLGARRASSEIWFWSVAYQLSNLSILGVVAASWGEPRWLTAIYLGVPLALLISSIPVTVGGFGLRESLFLAVLGAYGMEAERALTLALLWFSSSALLAIAGVFWLVGERSWTA